MKGAFAGLDKLYSLFKSRKRISLSEASEVLGLSKPAVLKWAKLLQDDGMLAVEHAGEESFLVWTGKLKSKVPPAAREEGEAKLKLPSPPGTEKDFQNLVGEYASKIEEIKRKSSELQELSKERTKIIYTKYIPLERKFEAELQLLHDQLAEKERQISEFEKRVRSLPDRMLRVEEQAKKLEQIEVYARKNVSEARVKIQAETARIHETQGIIEQTLRDVNHRIEEQTGKLKKIEKELIRLRKIEQWMMVQQGELERSLDEVAKERKDDLKDFSSLKSSVTTDYVKNYVKELTALKDKYERETHGIQANEEELNTKIKNARRELARLTTESKELIDRFESMSGKKKEKKPGEKEEWKAFEKDLKSISSVGIE